MDSVLEAIIICRNGNERKKSDRARVQGMHGVANE